MQKLADVLHTILCEKKHTYDIENLFRPDCPDCQYYLEDQMLEAWDCRDHKEWLQTAASFAAQHSTDGTAAGLESQVTEAFRLSRPVAFFLGKNPQLTTFVRNLIFS